MTSDIKILLFIALAVLLACNKTEKNQMSDKKASASIPPLDHYYLAGQQPFSGEDLVSRVRITGFHKATGLINSYTLVCDIMKRCYTQKHYGNSEEGEFSKSPIDFQPADSIMKFINDAFLDGSLKTGGTYLDIPHTDYLALTIETAMVDAAPMSAEYFFYELDDLPEKAKLIARQYLTDSLWIPPFAKGLPLHIK